MLSLGLATDVHSRVLNTTVQLETPLCWGTRTGQVLVKTEGMKMTTKNPTIVKDPVCGMDIETATAAGRTEYKGQTHYFCGSRCKEKFDLNPAQYLGKPTEEPKSGHGCCG